jgi:hypothetical protein
MSSPPILGESGINVWATFPALLARHDTIIKCLMFGVCVVTTTLALFRAAP